MFYAFPLKLMPFGAVQYVDSRSAEKSADKLKNV